jgi:hypothetical protein
LIEEGVGQLSGAKLTPSPQRVTAALDPFADIDGRRFRV